MVNELPNGWQSMELEQAMDAILDYRGKSPKKTNRGVPLVTAKIVKHGRINDATEFIATDDYDSWMRRGLPKIGDVLLTTEAPLGEVAQIRDARIALAQRLIALRGNNEILDNTFLKFLLQSDAVQNELLSRSTGTTVVGIKQRELRKITLHLPPIDEQRRIGGILGTLDDKIELNRQMKRTLEAMARAIFKAWFVDFEPIKAKTAGAKSFRGIPQTVFDQLPDRFTDAELGPVPEGWAVKPIVSIASISRDSIAPADSPDEIFEHFSIPAFDAGMRPARDLGSSIKSNKFAVSPHSVLVSKLNPRFARVWLPDEPTNGARQICSTEFLVITPKDGWSREQLFCQFLEVGFREALEQRASGTSTSHQRIRPKDFEKTIVVSPPMNMREAFVESVGPLFAKAANSHRESQTLAAIRDILLPKLISGELRVPVAEGGADGG